MFQLVRIMTWALTCPKPLQKLIRPHNSQCSQKSLDITTHTMSCVCLYIYIYDTNWKCNCNKKNQITTTSGEPTQTEGKSRNNAHNVDYFWLTSNLEPYTAKCVVHKSNFACNQCFILFMTLDCMTYRLIQRMSCPPNFWFTSKLWLQCT